MTYRYRLKPETLRFQPIPPFIFPLQSLPVSQQLHTENRLVRMLI